MNIEYKRILSELSEILDISENEFEKLIIEKDKNTLTKIIKCCLHDLEKIFKISVIVCKSDEEVITTYHNKNS